MFGVLIWSKCSTVLSVESSNSRVPRYPEKVYISLVIDSNNILHLYYRLHFVLFFQLMHVVELELLNAYRAFLAKVKPNIAEIILELLDAQVI